MKFLFDYFPIFCFFIAYKFFGIYIATATTMAASILQVTVYWIKHHKFENMHIVTLTLVLLLGASTLISHNDIFIKLKPSVIYWVFSLILLGSQFIGRKTILQRMLDDKILLPKKVWLSMNSAWTVFFFAMGFINLYVVYHFNTNTWVNFKLFGTLGLTLVFILIQSIFIAKHIKEPDDNSPE